MGELKKFPSSTFDTTARRRLVEDQDTILELTGKKQELQNEVQVVAHVAAAAVPHSVLQYLRSGQDTPLEDIDHSS